MKLGRCVRSLGLAAVFSCAHVGPFVWVDDYAPPADADARRDYLIAPGDLLSVNVFRQEGMATRERVRQDGKISVPMLGDVLAAGRSPGVLTEEIQSRLKAYINAPIVTVAVEETRPIAVPVLGEVAHPGQYNLEKGAGVLDALAAAGGFTDFAHRDRIFVLRRQPALVRIRCTFEALSRGQGRAIAFRLQPGDAVVVE
ncbi:MAG TPA: polysaccharide biosynthesis/export family protein [Myxococcales bacterium]|nr:polysaccharide biosynthesis/export family protein [Myxococcales bacterium]